MYKNRNIAIGFVLITLIFIGTVISIFNCHYGSNDNIGILWNIKSDCLVSFMSVSLGKILSFCYLNISKNVPWYGLTLYILLGLSLYLFILSVLKIKGLKGLLVPFLAMYLALFLRHVLLIDYSAVSILLGSASLLGLLTYLEKTDKKCFLPVFIMGICFSFSYHIRMDGIRAALCFTAPAVLLGVFRNRQSYRYLLVFMIPLAVAIPADRFYRNAIETESDIRFREWNTLRGQFHEFPVQRLNRDNEKIRDVNNWSKNDYLMLSQFTYFDEIKFNIGTLKNVFDYSLPLQTVSKKGVASLIGHSCLKLLKMYPAHICVLIFIALLYFIARNKSGGAVPVIYLSYVLGGAMGMQLYFRFPGRIGYPILLSCIMSMAYIVFNTKKVRLDLNNGGKKLIIFAGVIFTLFACNEMCQFSNIAKKTSLRQKNHYKSIKELQELNAEFVLIHPARGLIYHFSSPLKDDNYNPKTILGGWTIFSPLFYKALRENGMGHAYEIFSKLANEEDCFAVGDKEYITLISTYLWETYGLRNRFIPVKELSNQSTVYKIEVL